MCPVPVLVRNRCSGAIRLLGSAPRWITSSPLALARTVRIVMRSVAERCIAVSSLAGGHTVALIRDADVRFRQFDLPHAHRAGIVTVGKQPLVLAVTTDPVDVPPTASPRRRRSPSDCPAPGGITAWAGGWRAAAGWTAAR